MRNATSPSSALSVCVLTLVSTACQRSEAPPAQAPAATTAASAAQPAAPPIAPTAVPPARAEQPAPVAETPHVAVPSTPRLAVSLSRTGADDPIRLFGSPNGPLQVAILGDHRVRLWGTGGSDLTGRSLQSTPTVYAPLAQTEQVVSGFWHACALLVDGTVQCWGRGVMPRQAATPRPTVVAGLEHVTHLAAGLYHTCAVLSDATVRCWGNNGNGALGTGDTTNHAEPVAVAGLASVADIAAGSAASCAVLTDKTVRCWGQLPSGAETAGRFARQAVTSPQPIAGLANVRGIAMGSGFACALQEDGHVSCWGDNASGQLGDGTTTGRLTPTAVSGVSNAVKIVAGQSFACALDATGSISCWGDTEGALGGPPRTPRPTPNSIAGIGPSVDVAATMRDVCALQATGEIRCWGANAVGTVGDGTTTSRWVPTAVHW